MTQAEGRISDDFASSPASRTHKYRGILKRSLWKTVRDTLFSAFVYSYTLGGAHIYIIRICHWFWILQTVVCACFPLNLSLWNPESLSGKIMNVVSVTAFVAPSHSSSFAVGITGVVVQLIFWLFVGVAFLVMTIFQRYKRFERLSIELNIMIMNALIFCVANMSAATLGRSLCLLTDDDWWALHMVVAVMALVSVLGSMMFIIICVTPQLTFRPHTIHILYARPAALFHVANIVRIVMSTGSSTDGYGAAAQSYISALACIPMLVVAVKGWYWVSEQESYEIGLSVAASGVLGIVFPTMSLLKVEANEIAIVAAIATIGFFRYVYSQRLTVPYTKCKEELDELEEDPELVEDMSYAKIMTLLRMGFENGHPFCHRWELFDIVSRLFPDDRHFAIMYARYSVIYPDDTEALGFSIMEMKRKKKGSLEICALMFQMRSLLQQRERGFSKGLRKRISSITEKTEKCRSQIRYLWECVIQHKTSELQKIAATLKVSEEEILYEYKELSLVYPNNTYVASAFAAFLSDIMGRRREAAEYGRMYRLLRAGGRTREERSYCYASKYIPALPTIEQHVAMRSVDGAAGRNDNRSMASTASSMTVGTFDVEMSEEMSQYQYLESMIDEVRTPSMRYGPFVVVFAICLLVPIVTIVLTALTVSDLSADMRLFKVCQAAAQLSVAMSRIPLFSFQYALSTLGKTKTFAEWYDSCNFVDESVVSNDREMLLDAITRTRTAIQVMTESFSEMVVHPSFEVPMRMLLTPMIPVDEYTALDTEPHHTEYTIPQICTHLIGIAVRISVLDDVEIMKNPDFLTMIKNTEFLHAGYQGLSSAVLEAYGEVCNERVRSLQVQGSILLVGAYLCAVIAMYVLVRAFDSDNLLIFKAFRSLSKSVVSNVIQKLNDQSGKVNTERHQVTRTHYEENALRVLATPRDDPTSQAFWKRHLVIMALSIAFSVASLLITISLVLGGSAISQTMRLASPLHDSVYRIRTVFSELSVDMFRAAAMRSEYGLSSYINDDPDELFTGMSGLLDTARADLVTFRYELWRNMNEWVAGGTENLRKAITVADASCPMTPSNSGVCELLECMSYDNSLTFVMETFTRIVGNGADNIKLDDENIGVAMAWIIMYSTDGYRAALSSDISTDVEKQVIWQETWFVQAPAITLALSIIVIGCLALSTFIGYRNNILFFLRLLLFCDPQTILQSKLHFKILSNDFSGSMGDENEEDLGFYSSVVGTFLDGALFLDNGFIIRSVNDQAVTLLGKQPEELIGSELFAALEQDGEPRADIQAFANMVKAARHGLASPCIDAEFELSNKTETVLVHASLIAVSGWGEVHKDPTVPDTIACMTLTLRDMSAISAARTEIERESVKYAELLSVVMPKVVGDHVQAGVEGICYSIPNASFMCIEVIGLSDRCTSHTPEQVFDLLDKLFQEINRVVANYSEIVVLKTLSGSYLAAGGLFSEVNQSALHAGQIVRAGVDIISAVDLFNIEFGENITIRVGVDVGGPIIAGVIQLEVPVFEVAGMPYIRSRVMVGFTEPMTVIVSNAVYELIYGAQLIAKEGPEVVINEDNTIRTYVVKGYDKES